LYQPFTLSCVMDVDFIHNERDETPAVLKLYDRRFASQLRSDYSIDPWALEHENAFTEFVRSGGAEQFLKSLRDDDDFCEPEDGWDIAENEAFLHWLCLKMYKTENSVYTRLRKYQGTRIPRLLAQVSLKLECPNAEPKFAAFGIKGILLELIPGFTLAQMELNVPRRSWQIVVDKAIEVVHILSDHDILNQDVRPSNILVSMDKTSDHGYRVVMIDFAQCRFRTNDESDLEWGRVKWSQDEEGAIGMVMQSRLKKLGFDLKYRNSMRFWKWAERDAV